MSLLKAIFHGKEKRRPHRGSKAVDYSCRNHGGCPYCEENRQRQQRLLLQVAEEDQTDLEVADQGYIAFNTCDVCGDSGRHVRFGGRMFSDGETMTPWMCPECAGAYLAEEEQAELLGKE